MENPGLGIVLICCIITAISLTTAYYMYQVSQARLEARDGLDGFIIEDHDVDNDFIFKSIWRYRDVVARAQHLGYQFNHYDTVTVINRIRQNFTQEAGININAIDKAIRQYVADRVNKVLEHKIQIHHAKS